MLAPGQWRVEETASAPPSRSRR
ncbi:pseudouridine synthase, partial [Xanthomonas oryzae pv. oryzae]